MLPLPRPAARPFAGRTPRQSKRGRYHEPGRSGGLDLSPRRITVRIYLGVDGGGSKTRFALIEQSGRVLARHEEGPAYYPQIGLEGMRRLLARGVEATIKLSGVAGHGQTVALFWMQTYSAERA